ncbi:phage major capsid protein [Lysobacter sp. CA199]|uniref:phage major capsid protein n=1 Tax=Lysobacter sp. CA199 TaxID=3455608 RepID=UPI003F8D12EC
MPYSPPALEVAAKASIDYHLKNEPIDQIAQEKPLLKNLMDGRKSFAGGLQYVTEQVITNYGENGQWVSHNDTLDFNNRNPNDQAKYIWSTYRDGMGISEDEATQNGFILTDDQSAKATDAERVALVDLVDTKMYALKEGMQKGLDFQLHQDGTQSAKAIPGLDLLVALDPTTGIVGGFNRATAVFFRNYAKTGIVAANILDELEVGDRATKKNGGAGNRYILAGEAWIDNYRKYAKEEIQRHVVVSGKGGTSLDGGITELYYKGIPIIWDPTFEDLDAALAPLIPWTKRAYLLNKKHMKMRPVQGHDFKLTKPQKPHNQYVHYWDYKLKHALSMDRANAHGVFAIA